MNENQRKDFDHLKTLIESEVEAGFHIKPEHEIRSRLKDRLSDREKQKKVRFALLKPVPILIGALVILCGGLIGVFVVGKKPPLSSSENYIARFFEGTPGIQTLSQWTKLNRLISEANFDSTPPQPKNFINIFKQVEEDALVERSNIQIQNTNKYPALDFEQMTEILFEKKIVHRFLNQFTQINKEEKNG